MFRKATGADISDFLSCAVAAMVFVAGCGFADTISPPADDGEGNGGGNELPDYRDRALQGTVGGEQWTYSHATVSESVSGEAHVSVYGGDDPPSQPCSNNAHETYEGWSVHFRLPAVRESRWEFKPGERVLAFSKSTEDSTNYTTTQGWVELVTARTKTVSGKLVARANSNYVVNGEFLAERCENDQPVAGP